MGFLLFFLIPTVLFAVPMLLITDRISYRADAGGVRSAPYLWSAIVGSFVGWLIANVVVVTALNVVVSKRLTDSMFYVLFLLLGLIGATFVPALCYLLVRMRTARDPDYEELRGSLPSHITHIPQPRDRDDLLAK
jgi:H+/Cl- antiporter ClcA